MKSAAFFCKECGKTAGEARLEETGELRVSGPVCTLAVHEDSSVVKTAIESQDAKGLYDFDWEYAPFYCPECDACFCRDHWVIDAQLDDDFPGWYDCSYGTCPRGHRRIIDD